MSDLQPLICSTLRKVRHEIFTGPETWTQGQYARNAEGRHVHVESADAVCFCFAGAIQKALDAVLAAINKRVINLVGWSIITYNDMGARKLEDIHAVCDRVMEESCREK
jgi:hypothetical protein